MARNDLSQPPDCLRDSRTWSNRGVWFVLAGGQTLRLIVHVPVTGEYKSLWNGKSSAFCGENSCGRSRASFGWLIAKLLNEACARSLVLGLVLVGPYRLRENIREGLDPAATARILAESSLNLAQFQGDELSKRLAVIARRPGRSKLN